MKLRDAFDREACMKLAEILAPLVATTVSKGFGPSSIGEDVAVAVVAFVTELQKHLDTEVG